MATQDGPGIPTRDEARNITERIVGRGAGGPIRVLLRARHVEYTRFAANRITTSGDALEVEAEITAWDGRRSASVRANVLDDRRLATAMERAKALAALAPEDPEHMPLVGPRQYRQSSAYFDGTAALSAEARATEVAAFVEPVAAAGLAASGFLTRRVVAEAVADSDGLFAYHRSTLGSHTATVRTADGSGSGWVGTTHNDWSRTEPARSLADRAIAKAERSAGAQPLEPGRYTVVFEPTAAANLVRLLPSALDARAADEGRSAFSKAGGGTRVGDSIASAQVTLYSDPADEELLERPFTTSGEPIGRTVWIEGGVLRSLSYSRFWAERQGRNPTPSGGGLAMRGGDASTSALVGDVEDGILVTRLWYIRQVDRRSLGYTGLTRDGTFRIREGQVVGPVKNLRFNESVLGMLERVERLGAPSRVVTSVGEGLHSAVRTPSMLVRGFRFTSVSDAV